MTAPTLRQHQKSMVVGWIKTVFLGFGGFLIAFPFLWMIFGSLKLESQIVQIPTIANFLPSPWTLEPWRFIWQATNLSRAFMNSVIVSTGVTLSQVFIGSLAGYAFGRLRFFGRDVLFALVLLTMMIPGELTLIPQYIIALQLDLTNTHLGIMIPFLVGAYGIFLFRQFFRTIPIDLSEAAKIDGCGELGVLFRVIMPLSKPVMITVAIFSFVGSWNQFLWPLLMGRRGHMHTLPVLLSFFRGNLVAEGFAPQMAMAAVIALPLLALYFFLQRYIIGGMVMTGMKG